MFKKIVDPYITGRGRFLFFPTIIWRSHQWLQKRLSCKLMVVLDVIDEIVGSIIISMKEILCYEYVKLILEARCSE